MLLPKITMIAWVKLRTLHETKHIAIEIILDDDCTRKVEKIPTKNTLGLFFSVFLNKLFTLS